MKKVLMTGLLSVCSFFAQAQLPDPGFSIDERTAIVITDPQNDFFSETGKGWGIFKESIQKNQTKEHIEQIFKAANEKNMLVFVSPHYYYKHDHQWHFEGPVEKMMHVNGMFERTNPIREEHFEGSGADWYTPFKKYINGDNFIITSPHKIFGPETNDLVLQLRKRGIDKVVLIGMAANLCSESHLRELLEQGFETAVIFDATAGAIIKEANIDAPAAALTNFRMLAGKVYQTRDFLKEISKLPVIKKN